ncbi:MAG: TRAP transporter small permease subunit [Kiloniellales bacterium]|nr:TRAP transporter small permease subunit [Kiloniellales bacterium]
MAALAAFVRSVDRLNDAVGRGVAWLTLAMVLITFAVVLLRYVFAIGWVWMQESYVWLHGIVFMLGAGYTLLHNGHVRVDIFYRDAGERRKALVDLFGSLLLLLPVVALIFWVSLDYVLDSWIRLEESREAGGLPGLFLLKTVILGFCVLLGLQGLSLAGRSLLVLRGDTDPAGADGSNGGGEAGGVA